MLKYMAYELRLKKVLYPNQVFGIDIFKEFSTDGALIS